MNVKLERYLNWFREGTMQVLKEHPVELLLLVVNCVGWIGYYAWGWKDAPQRITLLPAFAIFALIISNLAGNTIWRRLYWVCWLPAVPLICLPGLSAWLCSVPGVLTLGVLLPLGLLMCRRAVVNGLFVRDLVVWQKSAVLALLFANVALGLFCAILFSTSYIFSIDGEWVNDVAIYAVILIEGFAVPTLFLMMSDRWRDSECTGSRLLDVLFNYILIPALLIYMVILYLYMAKIAALWSLPRGGVAYMVFGFMTFAILVNLYQSLLQRRIYDWFFNRFSLFLLPVQLLFWAGVVRRTNEYGFTEQRVFLVACGALMTLCVLLFLSRRTGRYLYLCLAGFLLFAAIAYIPSLHPKAISHRSQIHRIERVAERLGIRGENGQLRLENLSADTTLISDYSIIDQGLEYIGSDVAQERFGCDESAFLKAIPCALQVRVIDRAEYWASEESNFWSVAALDGQVVTAVADYKTLYLSPSSWDEDAPLVYGFNRDTLTLTFHEPARTVHITAEELLSKQLRKIGYEGALRPAEIKPKTQEFLIYTDEQMMVIFSDMQFERTDSLSAFRLTNLSVGSVLVR